jgi:hypothetical protein
MYRYYGIDVAMQMLRPGAKWEWTSGVGFTRWDDPRPCPSWEEVEFVMKKIKELEDAVPTMYLPEQQAKIDEERAMFEKAAA